MRPFLSRRTTTPLSLTLIAACASLQRGNDRVPETIEVAARAEAAIDTVWPGFRPIERGFIVFEPGDGAWLVTDHAPPAPWTPMPSDVPRLQGRLYRRTSDLPGLTGGIDTGYRVGDRRYTAVELEADLAGTLTTLFHESFHTYQDEAFAGFENEYAPPSALTPEQVAGAELERRILAAALRTSGPSADSLVAAFLAVRRDRMAALPDAIRLIEPSLERREGTAHLVGLRAVGAAGGRPGAAARATENVIRTLEMDLADHGAQPASQYRWRAYGTGSAMGVLLDRYGVDWRPQVQAGATLDALLLRAAPVAPTTALLEEARRRFGYAALLGGAGGAAAPASAAPTAEFLARSPDRLVVEIDAEAGDDLGMSFDPGSAGFTNPEPSVMLIERVERASMTTPGFDLSVSDRPLLVDGSNAPRLRLIVLLPDAPTLDGAPAVDLTGPRAGTLSVRGADTEVIIRGGHLLAIDVDGGVVTVRVRP